MAKTAVIEDMRDVDPVGYIRATGLRPEDSYGFLPIDLNEGTSFFFLYRDRPEYEQARPALPGAVSVGSAGGLAEVVGMGGGGGESSQDISDLGKLGEGLGGLVAEAQKAQEMWGAQGVAGGPQESEADRIAGIERLKKMGAINEQEYKQLVSEVKGGSAGPEPGGAKAAKAAKGAPDIVMHRVYPGMRMRSSLKQLDDFMPAYRDALGLCPEDVYGVFPRGTRTSNTSDGFDTEWDDFWIVYRDREEYAAGREAWAKKMNKKGKWPEAEVSPGVAEAGKAAFDDADIEVEKDRWPREKMVMRKQGSDLGDALRKKIEKWGYEPEDSFGFCPDFENSGIYFAWRKR